MWHSLQLQPLCQMGRCVVASSAGRIIKPTDIVHPSKEVEPISYFRVNGLTTIYLRVTQYEGSIRWLFRKHSLISELKLSFPQNFSMLVIMMSGI